MLSPNLMAVQKGKGWQEIRTIKTFKYENTRSSIKCCSHWQKRKIKVSDKSYKPGASSNKVTPDIDFADVAVVQWKIPLQIISNKWCKW